VFGLKKLLGFWLMPVPLILTLAAAGLVLSLRSRSRRAGRVLGPLALALLAAISNRTVSTALIRPLEFQYPSAPDTLPPSSPVLRCRYVVVLGSANTNLPGLPSTSRLSSSGLGRLVEAVRLLRALPGATLLVSGPSIGGHPSHATVLSRAAQELGVDASRIRLIDSARDTEEEAAAVARIAGDEPVALVTSAWHMPRAARLFRAAGVKAVPCPADYNGRTSLGGHLYDWGFDSESVGRSTQAVHEALGLLWLTLRGIP
jgi:uncharacterized SAM-binding protein YcdF (DUF218 family)